VSEVLQGFPSILNLIDTEQQYPSPLPKKLYNLLFLSNSNGNSWISAIIAQSSQSAGVLPFTFAQSFVKVEEYYERFK